MYYFSVLGFYLCHRRVPGICKLLSFIICIEKVINHSRNPALQFQTHHLAVHLHVGNYSLTTSHLIAVKMESDFQVLSGLQHPSTSSQQLPVSVCRGSKLAW